ncbi:hypothetical protein BDN71DRAFT_1505792 [Pleurotus eryngii]|uniref:Uncharacterized protein n=1 Tax=Pleurotus eryngii TaxID=5323 RepID=A0A9P6DGU7_PLEER|nr:hypothetical protein BDN71DRAFT_1505792 [Pleurotus eryngii]
MKTSSTSSGSQFMQWSPRSVMVLKNDNLETEAISDSHWDNFLRKQFSLASLARFLDMDLDTLQDVIGKLQAIITITHDTPQFRKSFVDYITDDARSNELCTPPSQGVIAFAVFVHHENTQRLPHTPKFLDRDCHVPRPTGSYTGSCHKVHDMDTGNEEAAAIFNLNLKSEEILPEETLRLMLTTCAKGCVKAYPQRDRMSFQFAKTLLFDLSNNDGICLGNWITTPIYYHPGR